MAAAAAAAAGPRMKLLIDTKAQRVLLAEAGKDAVDFLFSLLALPVATAASLAGKESVAGSVGNLYASVENIVQPGAEKDALLHPTVVSPAARISSSLLPLPAPSSAVPSKISFFQCSNYNNGYRTRCSFYMTDAAGTKCPVCGYAMTAAIHYVAPAASGAPSVGAKGFVPGEVTYTVTDNLTVAPMSTVSSFRLLKTFAMTTDLAALQEKTETIGHDEGLKILKASLQSKTVLTDVFLAKKSPSDA